MTWEAVQWQIPLGARPTIAHTGCALHGSRAIERYQLPRLWCIHIYRYEAELLLDGVKFPIRPGYAGIIPAGTPMEYRYRGRSPHVYAHFQPGAGTEAVKSVPIRAMQDLGGEFERINRSLEEAVGYFSTDRLRAEIRLWDILWQLAKLPSPGATPFSQYHPAVQQTCNDIEMRLAEPLYVGDLARNAGLSQNHLTRLFRQATGMTVVAYIRDRRVQRAIHFLKRTTIPIKEIAQEVGIHDPQLFNKTVRHITGVSPRKLRYH